MNPSNFTSFRFGEIVGPNEKRDYSSYLPNPLDRSIELENETVMALSAADVALGRLAGAGRLFKEQRFLLDLLVEQYMFREALASTRIEGTQTSLTEVLLTSDQDHGSPSIDVREVRNYFDAMNYGWQQLADSSITPDLIKEMHKILLRSEVRGAEKRPGHFRDDAVWIESPTNSPHTALFVPPSPDAIGDLFDDLSNFIRADLRMPPLIQCAIMHYQFETIHPFFDGNGRLGRLLIILFLLKRHVLPSPLLYISSYFEERRREYYDRLQAVRERGEIQQWLQFFLTAVARQAEDAVERTQRLLALRETYRQAVVGNRGRAVEVVELLFDNPVISTQRVQEKLGLSNQGALNVLRQLEERTWLTKIDDGPRGRRQHWLAIEVFQILTGPISSAPEVQTLW